MSQQSNTGDASSADYLLRKLREIQAEQEKAMQGQYIPSYVPQPCPDCGSCPTCGRRGRYTITYGYPGYYYQY